MHQLRSVVVMVNDQMQHIGSCEVIKGYKEFREEIAQENYRSLELLFTGISCARFNDAHEKISCLNSVHSTEVSYSI